MKARYVLSVIWVSFIFLLGCQSVEKKVEMQAPSSYTSQLLTDTRQLTFGGKRSGEGYFSSNGELMVFQSERLKDNPFYQIYLMNMKTGETRQVSNGIGKTTCSWVHPSQRKILFASTHLDPKAKLKQQKEIEERASGQQKRYAWDYDENYDLFEAAPDGKILRRLTKEWGYDAEGSYSPDGKWVAFASNRHAYLSNASEKLKKMMEHDPSVGMEIYIMKSDGTQVKRLTNYDGYDGGPFFSPDGKRITWRRFSVDGRMAEIYTMNIDGSDQKQITHLNAMSWAPFYHPSGDYLIFTTNLQGYQNFELYIVDVNGIKDPIRVTNLEGFDGLPVFTPDGRSVAWSRKDQSGESQIYTGKWNDELARKALGLPPPQLNLNQLHSEVTAADAEKIVQYLASTEMKGRATGSPEEEKYQKAIIEVFKNMGLTPGGPNGQWTQTYQFIKSVTASEKGNLLSTANNQNFLLNKEWLPLASSAQGEFRGEDFIFAGYGLVVPAENEIREYNSYNGKVALEGQWLVMLRDIPSDVGAQERVHYFQYSRPDYKIMQAKQRGAKGVIFITGPRTQSPGELMELSYDRASGESSIPVLSMTRAAFLKLLADDQKVDFETLQKELDKGEPVEMKRWQSEPFQLQVQLEKQTSQGSNVIADLKVNSRAKTVMVGAHGDHLGVGKSATSLMKEDSSSDIHFGADDNASGVAGVIEVAHYLSERLQKKQVRLSQNVRFAIWSGEELGNLGSSSYIKSLGDKKIKNISSYINMDMIGRMDKFISVQGVGSSSEWDHILEQMSAEKVLAIKPQSNPYLPTDAMAFYMAGVPILNFFTGAHQDYHTPQDTFDKINYKGMEQIVSYVERLTEKLAFKKLGPKYQKVEQEKGAGNRGGFRIFLGTIPDYTQEGVKGVRLQGVIKGGPAETAGLKGGDIIVQLSEHKVQSLYDYVYTLQVVKPGEATTITVLRNGEKVELPITPQLKK
ncbi:MAG: M28 family peptidase [Bdellovibrionales bacterium]|nr:M28 family peptidase [Bdellovibrionales bacterium]